MSNSLKKAIEQALNYKSATFQLINKDLKTQITRTDLYNILELLDKENDRQTTRKLDKSKTRLDKS